MTTNKVYSLFNASGKIEEIKPAQELPIGTKIVAFGGGMSKQVFCITSGKDQNGAQNMCLVSDYYPGSYFSPKAKFDKYSRPLSKKFGIGFYWDDINNVIFSESTVKAAIRRADYLTKKEAQKKTDKETADKKERDELPKKYPHLTPIDKGGDAKSNLLAELKNKFPGVKFTAKKENYSTYYVTWYDGPAVSEVAPVCSKFEDHETDYTGDYRDYNPSNFNRVFGGFKYVFENRKMTDETRLILEQAAETIKAQHSESVCYKEQIAHSLFCRHSFKNGEQLTGVKRNSRQAAIEVADLYDIETIVTTSAPAKIEGLVIVDYSDKALAVFGDTKPIKDKLKQIGGRFNPHLTHNGVKCAGWVFPKNKAAELNNILN